jgi:hypothetical protein
MGLGAPTDLVKIELLFCIQNVRAIEYEKQGLVDVVTDWVGESGLVWSLSIWGEGLAAEQVAQQVEGRDG